MPPSASLPSGFGHGSFVSGEKTRAALAAPGKVACFHRFPASKYHLIHNFHGRGHAAVVLHGETIVTAFDPFDLVPLNHR
jgi:hypothetical protein